MDLAIKNSSSHTFVLLSCLKNKVGPLCHLQKSLKPKVVILFVLN